MKLFQFYITDNYEGSIKGTDDVHQAELYAGSEDHFVVDTETGEWLLPDGARTPVEEAKRVETHEDKDDDN